MYNAEWKGEIEGFTVNYLAKNYWRVARSMEREDAMQEAKLIFLRCKARYHVEQGAHFMALYKRMLFSHFTDLSHKDTKQRVEIGIHSVDDDGTALPDIDVVGALGTDVEVRDLIANMPAAIRVAVTFLISDRPVVEEILTGLSKGSRAAGQAQARLDVLLGHPPGTNIATRVQKHFTDSGV